jgi:hypothetical protein
MDNKEAPKITITKKRKKEDWNVVLNLICVRSLNIGDFSVSNWICGGPGSSVSIATDYGLDGPGIESRWGEIFRTCPDWPSGLPSLLYNGCWVFPGGRKRPGRDADPSPPSSAEV